MREYPVFGKLRCARRDSGFFAFTLTDTDSVATIGTLAFEGVSGSNTTIFQLSSWITAFVACTFATNFICTCKSPLNVPP